MSHLRLHIYFSDDVVEHYLEENVTMEKIGDTIISIIHTWDMEGHKKNTYVTKIDMTWLPGNKYE